MRKLINHPTSAYHEFQIKWDSPSGKHREISIKTTLAGMMITLFSVLVITAMCLVSGLFHH